MTTALLAIIGKLPVSSLQDVNISGISSGQILAWDGVSAFVPVANAAAAAGVLNDLTDVFVAAPAQQDTLVYSGAGWTTRTYPPSLAALQDVTIAASPTSGHVLTYDASSLFILVAPPTAVVPSLAALPDVDVTGISSGDTLSFTGSYWQPVANPGLSISSLSDLGDVDVTNSSSGDFLGYRGAASGWGPTTVSLQQLADVSYFSAPTSGQSLLFYPGSGWHPGTPPTAAVTSLAGLPDVNVTGVQSGYALTYHASSLWVATIPPSAPVTAVFSLTGAINVNSFSTSSVAALDHLLFTNSAGTVTYKAPAVIHRSWAELTPQLFDFTAGTDDTNKASANAAAMESMWTAWSGEPEDKKPVVRFSPGKWYIDQSWAPGGHDPLNVRDMTGLHVKFDHVSLRPPSGEPYTSFDKCLAMDGHNMSSKTVVTKDDVDGHPDAPLCTASPWDAPQVGVDTYLDIHCFMNLGGCIRTVMEGDLTLTQGTIQNQLAAFGIARAISGQGAAWSTLPDKLYIDRYRYGFYSTPKANAADVGNPDVNSYQFVALLAWTRAPMVEMNEVYRALYLPANAADGFTFGNLNVTVRAPSLIRRSTITGDHISLKFNEPSSAGLVISDGIQVSNYGFLGVKNVYAFVANAAFNDHRNLFRVANAGHLWIGDVHLDTNDPIRGSIVHLGRGITSNVPNGESIAHVGLQGLITTVNSGPLGGLVSFDGDTADTYNRATIQLAAKASNLPFSFSTIVSADTTLDTKDKLIYETTDREHVYEVQSGALVLQANRDTASTVSSLGDLPDVTVLSPAAGEVLAWTGANWQNQPSAGFVAGPTSGDVLIYTGSGSTTARTSPLSLGLLSQAPWTRAVTQVNRLSRGTYESAAPRDPVHANVVGPAEYHHAAVVFGGSAGLYLMATPGASTLTVGTYELFFRRINSGAAGTRQDLITFNSRAWLRLHTDDRIRVLAQTDALDTCLDGRTSPYSSSHGYLHVLVSYDLADSNKRHMLVNGVDDVASWHTYANSAVTFTNRTRAIGYNATAALGNFADVEIGRAGFWPTYLDLGSASNVAQFWDARRGIPSGDLGPNGQLIVGSAEVTPYLYHYGPLSQMVLNQNGEGLVNSVVGTPTDGASARGYWSTYGRELIDPHGIPRKLIGLRVDTGETTDVNTLAKWTVDNFRAYTNSYGLNYNTFAPEIWWSSGGSDRGMGEPIPSQEGVYDRTTWPQLRRSMRSAAQAGWWLVPSFRVSYDQDQAALNLQYDMDTSQASVVARQGWADHINTFVNTTVVTSGGGTHGRFRDRFLNWVGDTIDLIRSDPVIDNAIAYWELFHFPGHRHTVVTSDWNAYLDDLVPEMIRVAREHDPVKLLGISLRQGSDTQGSLHTLVRSLQWTATDSLANNIVYVVGGYGSHDVTQGEDPVPNHIWPDNSSQPPYRAPGPGDLFNFDVLDWAHEQNVALNGQEGPGLVVEKLTNPLSATVYNMIEGILRDFYLPYCNGFAAHAWPLNRDETDAASGTDFWTLMTTYTGSPGFIPPAPRPDNLDVAINGTRVGVRGGLNLVAGGTVTLGVTDDPANDRLTITVSA